MANFKLFLIPVLLNCIFASGGKSVPDNEVAADRQWLPPCSSLGGQGVGFCPKDLSPCKCQGSFTDTDCCCLRGVTTFTCTEGGYWFCTGECHTTTTTTTPPPPPPCSSIRLPTCVTPGDSCDCVGSVSQSSKCRCCNGAICANGAWQCLPGLPCQATGQQQFPHKE